MICLFSKTFFYGLNTFWILDDCQVGGRNDILKTISRLSQSIGAQKEAVNTFLCDNGLSVASPTKSRSFSVVEISFNTSIYIRPVSLIIYISSSHQCDMTTHTRLVDGVYISEMLKQLHPSSVLTIFGIDLLSGDFTAQVTHRSLHLLEARADFTGGALQAKHTDNVHRYGYPVCLDKSRLGNSSCLGSTKISAIRCWISGIWMMSC